jgi:hypothetical protein
MYFFANIHIINQSTLYNMNGVVETMAFSTKQSTIGPTSWWNFILVICVDWLHGNIKWLMWYVAWSYVFILSPNKNVNP